MDRLLIALCVGFLLASSMSAGEPDQRLHLECIYPTVLITSQQNYGSGVIIDSRYCEDKQKWRNTVLSSAHVFTQGRKYEVLVGCWANWSEFAHYWYFDCEIGRIDYDQDICTVQFLSDSKLLTAKVSKDCKLFIGNDVVKVGCGLGDEMRLDYGKVTAIESRRKGRFRMSAMCVPGDSGGPVFHDYELVGITESVRYMATREKVSIPVPHIAYALPIAWFTDEDLCLLQPETKDGK
jgi:S1-C subfamily serine protease